MDRHNQQGCLRIKMQMKIKKRDCICVVLLFMLALPLAGRNMDIIQCSDNNDTNIAIIRDRKNFVYYI